MKKECTNGGNKKGKTTTSVPRSEKNQHLSQDADRGRNRGGPQSRKNGTATSFAAFKAGEKKRERALKQKEEGGARLSDCEGGDFENGQGVRRRATSSCRGVRSRGP